MSTPIQKKLEDNKEYLQKRLDLGTENFDIILKEMVIGDKKAALLFVDGLNNNEITVFVLRSLLETSREQIAVAPVEKLMNRVIPFAEIDLVDDFEEALREMLAGPMLLLIDGETEGLLIDTREYPVRDPQEPDIEKITRGSRDGFVETLVFNVALIRRRIRDPQLRCEMLNVGHRSVSDIALLYIKDIANPQILENVRSRIKKIDIDALPMAEKTVEEFITRSFWNPFPQVRYTERPDVAATHLFEGHIIIIVDTSPSVMIVPITFFHLFQHAEEFRHNPIVGTYIRWIRSAGVLLSFLLIPFWLLLAMETQHLPESLKFIGPKEKTSIPLYLQFIFAHFGLDLVRLASIHTPSPFATALGLVGALLIGQIAVEVGFFTPEILLYTGLVALGVFSSPSWELSMANRVFLLLLILLTGLLRLPGLILGFALVVLWLLLTRPFGFPYLWPLIPFNRKAISVLFYRRPIPMQLYRPDFLQTGDRDRTDKKR